VTTLRLDLTNAVWREIDGDVVVLGNGGTDYMSLNESGVLLWSRLEAGATLDQLVASIVGAYDVAPAIAQADVERFVTELRKRSLLLDA
jgi:hypothetical protein